MPEEISLRHWRFAFATQGDGNHTPDPIPVFGNPDIERVIYTKPYLGLALPFAKALLFSGAIGGLSFLWIVWQRARPASERRARPSLAATDEG